jgi:AP-1-like factor
MDTYQQFNPGFWNPSDLSYSTTTDFNHLVDDDFLSLLEKEFPDSAHPIPVEDATFHDAVNPKNISTPAAYAASLSPPSDDSSPSPPHQYQDENVSHEDHDSALKRKASNEQAQDGPSSKTLHTGNSISPHQMTWSDQIF